MVRPREFSFTPEEMEKLGQEMVEWIKINKPLHLSQWYTIEKGFTYNEWKNFIVKEEFFPYYEKSLKMVGMQYLDKESRIRDGISQRWQRVYFKDLKEEENESLEFEAKLKTDHASQVDPEILKKTDLLIESIDQARKRADKRKSKE